VVNNLYNYIIILLEQSRRDDLEAIGYVLMYFLRGSLPWQGLKVDKREDRYKKIYEKKKSTTAEELCVGYPSQFVEYINYTRNLAFEAEPDYEYLRGLFKSVMNKYSFEYDYRFEWLEKLGIDINLDKNLNTSNQVNMSNMINNNLNSKVKQENVFLSGDKNNEKKKTLGKYIYIIF
jgi:hypothetical protein